MARLHTFHVEPNILFPGKTTESITANTKHTGKLNVNTTMLMQPTLTHYELHLLHVAHVSPYKGQSSHLNFTATETPYIWVTQGHSLCVEPVSPYKGQACCPLFL